MLWKSSDLRRLNLYVFYLTSRLKFAYNIFLIYIIFLFFSTLPYTSFPVTFVDVNECETGQQDCSEFAKCVNTVGSHSCFCLSGFTGDGKNCSGK